MTDLVSQSYPSNSPISARPELAPAKGSPARACGHAGRALAPFRGQLGICNPLFGVQMVFSEDMADASPGAERLLVKEWLDKDARLRARS